MVLRSDAGIAGAAVAPRVVEQLVVALHLHARKSLFADELLQSRGGEQAPRKAQAANDGAPVAFLREVAWVDRQRVAGPVRLGVDITARQGPRLPGAGAEARRLFELADLAALEAAGAKVTCISGVADSSNTLAEAATIDGL